MWQVLKAGTILFTIYLAQQRKTSFLFCKEEKKIFSLLFSQGEQTIQIFSSPLDFCKEFYFEPFK